MGQIDYIGATAQDDEKVGATAVLNFPPVQSEGLEPNVEEMEYDETVGSRAPIETEYGGRFYEGDIEGAARPLSFGVFLTMAFGTPVSSTSLIGTRANSDPVVVGELFAVTGRLYEITTAGTTAASPPAGYTGSTTTGQTVTDGTAVATDRGASAGAALYEHTWDPVAAGKLPAPATIWTVNQDFSPPVIDKFVGTYLNELALEVEANGYLTFSASLAAMILDQTATAPTLTRDLTAKWAFHQVTAQLAVLGQSLAPLPAENFSLNYNNNLETGLFALGSQELETIRAGNVECGANFRPLTAFAEHYRRWLLTSPEFVTLKLTAVGQTIVGSHKNSLIVNLSKLQYMSAPVNIDAGEVMTGVDVETRAVIDAADTLLTVKIKNSHDGSAYVAEP